MQSTWIDRENNFQKGFVCFCTARDADESQHLIDNKLTMSDLVYVGITIVSFVILGLFAWGCKNV